MLIKKGLLIILVKKNKSFEYLLIWIIVILFGNLNKFKVDRYNFKNIYWSV